MRTLARDVSYAFRTFRRAPLATLTIIGTIALGLGLVAVVFTFYSALYLRPDAVPNPHELFEVRRPVRPGAEASVIFTARTYELVRRETDVFSGTFARTNSVPTRVEGKKATATLVTADFFDVLGVPARYGRTLNEDDDAGEPAIVLSDAGWARLFARDGSVIGRHVSINGRRHLVAGVMPGGFRGVAVRAPDYWAPLSLATHLRPSSAGKEDAIQVEVIGRLKSGLAAAPAAERLTAWAGDHPQLQTGERRSRATIALVPREGARTADAREGMRLFAPLFIAFGLVLLIGCANVANLLLARGLSRQREIGIRLSIGASRPQVVRQLLTESLLLAIAAAACGFVVTRLALAAALQAVLTTMPGEMVEYGLSVPATDWRVSVFLAVGALIATAFFGLAPAIQSTRLQLVQIMRGEITRDARPGRARSVLIGLQVAASALLLICAGIFLRGAAGAASFDHGIRTHDTIALDRFDEKVRPAIVDAVQRDPLVAAVAVSSPAPLGVDTWVEVITDDSTTQLINYKFVSPSYFDVLDIPLVRGRSFTHAEDKTESGVVLLSEGGAARLWPGGDPLGRVLRIPSNPRRNDPRMPTGTFTVVGIVRDVHGSRGLFPDPRDISLYLPANATVAGTSLVMRVHGDPDESRRQLLERLTRIDPALGELWTMRAATGLMAYVLGLVFWTAAVLGGLALILTLSGLFSVLSYVVEQRRTEIGVRVALGATSANIARLVLSQSFKAVAAGLGVGGLLAVSLATLLTRSRGGDAVSAVVQVHDPLPYIAGFALIAAACALAASIPALRASRVDPMTTLKYD